MENSGKKIETIDQYIKTFPASTQIILEQVRKVIAETAPEAKEAISYRMPTFKLNGNLIHFAGYQHHIGLYPTPSPIEYFKSELKNYKTSKGAIQFPIDKPIPFDFIKRIVEFRVNQNKLKPGCQD